MEKYAFVQRLGQGSFSVVWRARRKSDGRLVAIKQLKQSPESWDACKQLPEVRAAAAIADRRHVVALLEAVRHGGELFLVFEHLESSLHACMALGQRIDEGQVRWAARQLLTALAAVHAAGLVHCDVKPENILVGTEGVGSCAEPTLKLCDFGQASPPEQIGTYVGTRWYRPPELLLDSRGDQGVDLWAAGCVVAELVLRRPLFPGTDLRDMLFRISGELGVPEPAWPLAARMVEASGRPNAAAQAWGCLHEAGATEAGVALLGELLRYDSCRRLRAERALHAAFFAGGAEVPVSLPPSRPMSPENLKRSREEATAVERRLRGGADCQGLGRQAVAPKLAPRSSAQLVSAAVFGAAGAPCALPQSSMLGVASAPVALRRDCSGSRLPRSRLSSEVVRTDLQPLLPAVAVPSPLHHVERAVSSPGEGVQGAGAAGGSDDEALAQAFWGACKGRPATSPDGDCSEEETSPMPSYVAAVGLAGPMRSRRPRPAPA